MPPTSARCLQTRVSHHQTCPLHRLDYPITILDPAVKTLTLTNASAATRPVLATQASNRTLDIASRAEGPDSIGLFCSTGSDVLMLVLLAERDRYTAELCEFFLRTEGYDVCLASTRADAETLILRSMTRRGHQVVQVTMGGGAQIASSAAHHS